MGEIRVSFRVCGKAEVNLCACVHLQFPSNLLDWFRINFSFNQNGFHFSSMCFGWMHQEKDMQLLWASPPEQTVLYALCIHTWRVYMRFHSSYMVGCPFSFSFIIFSSLRRQRVFPHGSVGGRGGRKNLRPFLFSQSREIQQNEHDFETRWGSCLEKLQEWKNIILFTYI